jgi:hypothetical protein
VRVTEEPARKMQSPVSLGRFADWTRQQGRIRAPELNATPFQTEHSLHLRHFISAAAESFALKTLVGFPLPKYYPSGNQPQLLITQLGKGYAAPYTRQQRLRTVRICKGGTGETYLYLNELGEAIQRRRRRCRFRGIPKEGWSKAGRPSSAQLWIVGSIFSSVTAST